MSDINKLKNQIEKNEAINQYYRIQARRNDLITNYTNNSSLSANLSDINRFVDPNADVNIDTTLGSENLDANRQNLSADIYGTIDNNSENLKQLSNWSLNNSVLKDRIVRNLGVYDNDFIEKIDELDKKNKKIMNIDRLIQQNEYASHKKEQDIFVLKSYFSALIVIIVIGLFYMTGIISPMKFLYTIIGVIVLTTIFVLYQIYVNNPDSKIKKITDMSIETAKKLEKDAVKFISPLIEINECPKDRKCAKTQPSTPTVINPNSSITNASPVVSRDQSDNPFRYGITSPTELEALGASKMRSCKNIDRNKPGQEARYQECIKNIRPRQPVQGSPNAPIYVCKWNGNPSGMLENNKGLNVGNVRYFKTYIPCQYYPGYDNATDAEISALKTGNKYNILPSDN
jgi:hypothetical protein